MIVTVIMEILIILISAINRIVPDWIIPADYTNALAYMGVYIMDLNSLFPFRDMLIVVGMALFFEFMILMFRFGSGVISILRGGGKIDI